MVTSFRPGICLSSGNLMWQRQSTADCVVWGQTSHLQIQTILYLEQSLACLLWAPGFRAGWERKLAWPKEVVTLETRTGFWPACRRMGRSWGSSGLQGQTSGLLSSVSG